MMQAPPNAECIARESGIITKRPKNSTHNYPPINGRHGEFTPLHPHKTQSPSTRSSTTSLKALTVTPSHTWLVSCHPVPVILPMDLSRPTFSWGSLGLSLPHYSVKRFLQEHYLINLSKVSCLLRPA